MNKLAAENGDIHSLEYARSLDHFNVLTGFHDKFDDPQGGINDLGKKFKQLTGLLPREKADGEHHLD